MGHVVIGVKTDDPFNAVVAILTDRRRGSRALTVSDALAELWNGASWTVVSTPKRLGRLQHPGRRCGEREQMVWAVGSYFNGHQQTHSDRVVVHGRPLRMSQGCVRACRSTAASHPGGKGVQ
jgi:hypothetical protein